MPDISPEDSKLREIRELERQLAKKKASLGMDHPMGIADSSSEPEEYSPGWAQVAREGAREARVENRVEEENQFEAMASTIKTATTGSLAVVNNEDRAAEITNDVKSIMAMDAERRIQTLSALAWQKGISYSIEVARRLDDPYTLDLLHSQLSGELYEKLVTAKKLDNI